MILTTIVSVICFSLAMGFESYNQKNTCPRNNQCIEEEGTCEFPCDCDGDKLCVDGKCLGTARDCYGICWFESSSINCYDLNKPKILWSKIFYDSDGNEVLPKILSKNISDNEIAVEFSSQLNKSDNIRKIIFLDFLNGDILGEIPISNIYGDILSIFFHEIRYLFIKTSTTIHKLEILKTDKYLAVAETVTYLQQSPSFGSFLLIQDSGSFFYTDYINDENYKGAVLRTNQGKTYYIKSEQPLDILKGDLMIKSVVLDSNNAEPEPIILFFSGEDSGVYSTNFHDLDEQVLIENKVLIFEDPLIDICDHPVIKDFVIFIYANFKMELKKKRGLRIVEIQLLNPAVVEPFSKEDNFFFKDNKEILYRKTKTSKLTYFNITEKIPLERNFELPQNPNEIKENKLKFLAPFFFVKKSFSVCMATFPCNKTCLPPWVFLNPVNSTCGKSCPKPFIMSPTTNLCQERCPAEFLLFEEQRLCLDECPEDYFPYEGRCISCYKNISICRSRGFQFYLNFTSPGSTFALGTRANPFSLLELMYKYINESSFLRELSKFDNESFIEAIFLTDYGNETGYSIVEIYFWEGIRIKFRSESLKRKVYLFEILLFYSGVVYFENLAFILIWDTEDNIYIYSPEGDQKDELRIFFKNIEINNFNRLCKTQYFIHFNQTISHTVTIEFYNSTISNVGVTYMLLTNIDTKIINESLIIVKISNVTLVGETYNLPKENIYCEPYFCGGEEIYSSETIFGNVLTITNVILLMNQVYAFEIPKFLYASESVKIRVEGLYIFNEINHYVTSFFKLLEENYLLLENVKFEHSKFNFEVIEDIETFSLENNRYYSTFIYAFQSNSIIVKGLEFKNIEIQTNCSNGLVFFSLIKIEKENVFTMDDFVIKNVFIKQKLERGSLTLFYFGEKNYALIRSLLIENLLGLNMNIAAHLFFLVRENIVSVNGMIIKSVILNSVKKYDPLQKQNLNPSLGIKIDYYQNIDSYYLSNAFSNFIFLYQQNSFLIKNTYVENSDCQMSCFLVAIEENSVFIYKASLYALISSSYSSGFFLLNTSTLSLVKIDINEASSKDDYFIIENSSILTALELSFTNLKMTGGNSIFALSKNNVIIINNSSFFNISVFNTGCFLYRLSFNNMLNMKNGSIISIFEIKAGIMLAQESNLILFWDFYFSNFNFNLSGIIADGELKNKFLFKNSIFEKVTSQLENYHFRISEKCALLLDNTTIRGENTIGNVVYAFRNNFVLFNNTIIEKFSYFFCLISIIQSNLAFFHATIFSDVSSNDVLEFHSENKVSLQKVHFKECLIKAGGLLVLRFFNVIEIKGLNMMKIRLPITGYFIKIDSSNELSLMNQYVSEYGSENPAIFMLSVTGRLNNIAINHSYYENSFAFFKSDSEIKINEDSFNTYFSLIKILGSKNFIVLKKISVDSSLLSYEKDGPSYYLIDIFKGTEGSQFLIDEAFLTIKNFSGLLRDKGHNTLFKFQHSISYKTELISSYIYSLGTDKSYIELFNISIFDTVKNNESHVPYLYFENCPYIIIKKVNYRGSKGDFDSISSFIRSINCKHVWLTLSTFSFCHGHQNPLLGQRPSLLDFKNVTSFKFERSQVYCGMSSGENSIIKFDGTNLSIASCKFAFNRNPFGIGGVVIFQTAGAFTLFYNIFLYNEASLGGVFVLLNEEIFFQAYSNIFINNKASGGRYFLNPVYLKSFDFYLDGSANRYGSCFILKTSINAFFKKNIIRDIFILSFWHEINKKKAQDFSENFFNKRKKESLLMTTDVRSAKFYNVDNMIYYSRISIYLDKRELNSSLKCLIILVGFDDYGNLLPLSLPTSSSVKTIFHSTNILFFFRIINMKNNLGYTCLYNITTENENLSWNRLEITLQIDSKATYFNQSNIETFLTVSKFDLILEPCGPGEYLNEITSQCNPCERNYFSNKYNLSGLVLCDFCSDSAVYNCYGGNLRSPKPGYWQPSLYSSYFLKCPRSESCLGDSLFLESEDILYPDIKRILTALKGRAYSNRICSKHFTGPLCAECELFNGIGPNFTCNDCSKYSLYLIQLVMIVIRAALTWLTIKKALDVNKELSESKGIIPKEKESRVISGYFIKIFLEHLQHLTFLTFLPFEIPESWRLTFSFIIRTGSNDMKNAFSLECLLKLIGFASIINSSYFTIFAHIAFNILTVFVVALMLKKLRANNSKGTVYNNNGLVKILKNELNFILLYVFMTNIVGHSEIYFKMLFCYKINEHGDARLMSDLSVDCDTPSYRLMFWIVSLPLLFLILILLPGRLLMTLKRNKNELYKQEMLGKYSYFFFPYETKTYYFEICLVLKRITFLFLQILQDFILVANEGNQSLINIVFYLFGYLVIFLGLFLFLSPYKQNHFASIKTFESFSLNTLILTCVGVNVWWVEKDRFFLPFFLIVGGSNLIFIAFFIINYTSSNLKIINITFKKLKSKSVILINKLSIRSANSGLNPSKYEFNPTYSEPESTDLLVEKIKKLERENTNLLDINKCLVLQVKQLTRKLNSDMYISPEEESLEENHILKKLSKPFYKKNECGSDSFIIPLEEAYPKGTLLFDQIQSGVLVRDQELIGGNRVLSITPICGYEFWIRNSRYEIDIKCNKSNPEVELELKSIKFVAKIIGLIRFQKIQQSLRLIEKKRLDSSFLFLNSDMSESLFLCLHSGSLNFIENNYVVYIPFLFDPERKVRFTLQNKNNPILQVLFEIFEYESMPKRRFLRELLLRAYFENLSDIGFIGNTFNIVADDDLLVEE